ncbi:helicase C-terminal domain-containing protein [Nocardia fluminea]|uniref:helicase C-terminal domain-containing protein n=1 Tax=Nocardia fluminea TaxID=134984 RepID=UPI0033CA4ED4
MYNDGMPGDIDYTSLLSELGSSEFSKLRPGQLAALEQYSTKHSATADLAIELPTGAGKSLIALLIGEAWRRQGKTVAVLTGNKTLARQMEAEGTRLNVPIVRFEGVGNSIPLPSKRRYRRAQAIAVMNYWVMINQGSKIDGADLLIIDDAHLAESALDSLYSVEIDRYQHPGLFKSLVCDLAQAFPDYASLQDAMTDSPSRAGTELLSFLDQSAFADRFRTIMDAAPEMLTDDDLRYRWGRVRERIREVNVYCSTRSLCLRPYVYPLQDFVRYADAEQRIYLSATIGNPADLARRLGTKPIVKLPLESGIATETYGRRLIVLNPDDSADFPLHLQRVVIAALRVQPKSVWLCASKKDAEEFKASITLWLKAMGLPDGPTWLLSNLGDEIDQFKSSPTGHLFVGGRFDGMDFSADQCRLVVLATQPRAINLQEEFLVNYLRDAEFMIQRLNQRIMQALGRCNRSEDDYGVYVLADRRFSTHFSQESRRRGLPANIQAEIDLAENDTILDAAALTERVTSFLSGDFDQFDRDLAETTSAVPPVAAGSEGDDANAEITGWLKLYERQDYRSAESDFRTRQESYANAGVRELGAFAQWCEAKAAFLEGRRGDVAAGARSLETLEHAIARGGASSWFNRLRSSLLRYKSQTKSLQLIGEDDFRVAVVQSFDDHLERWGVGVRLEKWRNRMTAGLSSTSHDQFAESLEFLGTLLGFSASRPKYGAATDCRWRGIFGNSHEAVTWEAKIEHLVDSTIDAHAVGQAHNQATRAASELGNRGYTIRGVIVTHLDQLDAAAASSIGNVKVIRKDAVIKLWNHVNGLLGIYANKWNANSTEARLDAADSIASQLPPTGWLIRAIDTTEIFVNAETLLHEWPK